MVPEAEPVYQTISVHVKVFSICDRDLHLNVMQQKQLTPQIDVRLNNREMCNFLMNGYNKETYKRLHENIDIANVRLLQNTIYDVLR